jgi:hypothetical protein
MLTRLLSVVENTWFFSNEVAAPLSFPLLTGQGGRVVQCTALEMRHRCKPIGPAGLGLAPASGSFRTEYQYYGGFSTDGSGHLPHLWGCRHEPARGSIGHFDEPEHSINMESSQIDVSRAAPQTCTALDVSAALLAVWWRIGQRIRGPRIEKVV